MYEQGDTVCDCLHAVENFLWEMTLNSVTQDGKSWNKSWNSYICIIGWILDSEIWGMDLAIQNLKNIGLNEQYTDPTSKNLYTSWETHYVHNS